MIRFKFHTRYHILTLLSGAITSGYVFNFSFVLGIYRQMKMLMLKDLLRFDLNVNFISIRDCSDMIIFSYKF